MGRITGKEKEVVVVLMFLSTILNVSCATNRQPCPSIAHTASQLRDLRDRDWRTVATPPASERLATHSGDTTTHKVNIQRAWGAPQAVCECCDAFVFIRKNTVGLSLEVVTSTRFFATPSAAILYANEMVQLIMHDVDRSFPRPPLTESHLSDSYGWQQHGLATILDASVSVRGDKWIAHLYWSRHYFDSSGLLLDAQPDPPHRASHARELQSMGQLLDQSPVVANLDWQDLKPSV